MRGSDAERRMTSLEFAILRELVRVHTLYAELGRRSIMDQKSGTRTDGAGTSTTRVVHVAGTEY